jgi:hypothetical protein
MFSTTNMFSTVMKVLQIYWLLQTRETFFQFIHSTSSDFMVRYLIAIGEVCQHVYYYKDV